jgi:hypothetical protein
MLMKIMVIVFVVGCVGAAVVPKKEADYDEKVAVIVPETSEIANITVTTEKSEKAEDETSSNVIKDSSDKKEDETTPPPFKNIPKDTLTTLEEFLNSDFWSEPPFSIIARDDLDSSSKEDDAETKKMMEGESLKILHQKPLIKKYSKFQRLIIRSKIFSS